LRLRSSFASRAVEPRSDPAFKVHDGLTVWLDASMQSLAREQGEGTPLADGDVTDIERDGSGRKCEPVQTKLAACPKLAVEADARAECPTTGPRETT
jgi:hypothetical protein